VKPLIIGEAPSKNEYPPSPIAGRIGKRLAECAGLSLQDFLEHFERRNLLEVRQDTKEKGFEFDARAASLAADKLWHDGALLTDYPSISGRRDDAVFAPGRVVLLLGYRVATAFGAANIYFMKQTLGTEAEVYVLPHPSGVNRWWNDPFNAALVTKFMRSIVSRTQQERV
jgi:hypothetical protein